jgi:hypothetical protein
VGQRRAGRGDCALRLRNRSSLRHRACRRSRRGGGTASMDSTDDEDELDEDMLET